MKSTWCDYWAVRCSLIFRDRAEYSIFDFRQWFVEDFRDCVEGKMRMKVLGYVKWGKVSEGKG